jgi:hypothetical protein
MFAAVIGNVVVVVSWFGPPLLCAAVMTHLAWAYAGMLPAGWLRLRRTADAR